MQVKTITADFARGPDAANSPYPAIEVRASF
jgi:hypothetical protein